MYLDNTFDSVDVKVYEFFNIKTLETSRALRFKEVARELNESGLSFEQISGSVNFLIRKGILNIEIEDRHQILLKFVKS